MADAMSALFCDCESAQRVDANIDDGLAGERLQPGESCWQKSVIASVFCAGRKFSSTLNVSVSQLAVPGIQPIINGTGAAVLSGIFGGAITGRIQRRLQRPKRQS